MLRPSTVIAPAPAAMPRTPRRRGARLAISAIAGLTLTAALGAQTLTFDAVPGSVAAGGVRRVNNCLVQSGIRITALSQGAGGAITALPCETAPPTAASPTALAMYAPGNGSFLGTALFNDVGSGLEFRPDMGGSFSMLGLDLAPIFLLPPGTPGALAGTLPVTFLGLLANGGTTTQSFSLALNAQAFTSVSLNGFTNLSAVRVLFGAPDFTAQVDNVRFASVAVVPEPSAYLLMATGFVGLAAVLRRRPANSLPPA